MQFIQPVFHIRAIFYLLYCFRVRAACPPLFVAHCTFPFSSTNPTASISFHPRNVRRIQIQS